MFSKRFSPHTAKGSAIAELQKSVGLLDTKGLFSLYIDLGDYSLNTKQYVSLNTNPDYYRNYVEDYFTEGAGDSLIIDQRAARLVSVQALILQQINGGIEYTPKTRGFWG